MRRKGRIAGFAGRDDELCGGIARMLQKRAVF